MRWARRTSRRRPWQNLFNQTLGIPLDRKTESRFVQSVFSRKPTVRNTIYGAPKFSDKAILLSNDQEETPAPVRRRRRSVGANGEGEGGEGEGGEAWA